MVFSVSTHTSWQTNDTRVDLTLITQAMPSYPLIERKFFDDIVDHCYNTTNYSVEAGLLHVLNEEGNELDPDYWILLWAIDFRDRLFQILIERNPDFGGKGAIAAVGPPEFLEFISSMTHSAIMPTLTLLNTPDKMKSVKILVSRPPTHAQKLKRRQTGAELTQFKNWIDQLKDTPNPRGQWFPSSSLDKCPVCGTDMVPVGGYEIAFGQLVCPKCGFAMKKKVS